MLRDRKEQLFKILVREYVRTAEPVGSGRLAELVRWQVSPATIRFDLAELEAEGLLTHPHPSAGRIPTEEGYRFFIQNFLAITPEWTPERAMLRELGEMRNDLEHGLRFAARLLSEATGEAALASIGREQVFYTGLANLFSKPEFKNPIQVVEISEVLDRVDEIMERYVKNSRAEPHVYVGSENPFGSQCSTILVKIRIAPRLSGLLGLVGPMRMDYGRNVAVLRRMRSMVEEQVTTSH